MPTYEYACTSCGHQLEAVQSFSDDPLTECPECGGRLRKVFGSVGIVLKGSGFYKTDSRSAGRAGRGEKEAGGSATEAGSEKGGSEKSGSEKGGSEKGGSTDSKPAEKAPAASAAPAGSTAS
jgi:putative FmdB family regulatory protein